MNMTTKDEFASNRYPVLAASVPRPDFLPDTEPEVGADLLEQLCEQLQASIGTRDEDDQASALAVAESLALNNCTESTRFGPFVVGRTADIGFIADPDLSIDDCALDEAEVFRRIQELDGWVDTHADDRQRAYAWLAARGIAVDHDNVASFHAGNWRIRAAEPVDSFLS